MREIKFRGKLVYNGDWVDGDLLHHDNIVGIHKQLGDGTMNVCDVEPETVGQYTGLIDFTGKMIFEGDVVKIRDPYNGCWSINGGQVVFSTEYVGGWVVTSNGTDGLNLGTRQNNIEIIGNIHDDPELLEVADSE